MSFSSSSESPAGGFVPPGYLYVHDERDYMTRAELLRAIQRGDLEAGEYEGDEPWPLGQDPNESAQDALARYAREYAEEEATAEDHYDPVNVIAMHRPHRSEPIQDEIMSDTDSDSLYGQTSHHSMSPDPEDGFYPVPTGNPRLDRRPRQTIIADDGAAMELYDEPGITDIPNDHAAHVILERFHTLADERFHTLADGQDEQGAEHYLEVYRNLMMANGMSRTNIEGIIQSRRELRAPEYDSDQEQDDHELQAAWDVVNQLEGDLDHVRLELETSKQYLEEVVYQFRIDDLDGESASRFLLHVQRANMMTSYAPRVAAIATWCLGLPEQLRDLLDHILELHCREADIIRSIRQARLDAASLEGTTPLLNPREDLQEHPHERDHFDYNGQRSDEGEMQWGYEIFHPMAEVLEATGRIPYGSAVFEPPTHSSMSDNISEVMAGINVYMHRAQRSEERTEENSYLDARDRLIDRASIAQWYVQAFQWMFDNVGERRVREDDWTRLHYQWLTSLVDLEEAFGELIEYERTHAPV